MPVYGSDGKLYRDEPKDYYDSTDSSADKTFLSDADKALVQAAKDKWAAANAAGDKAGMDAAHAEAEAIREKYGYQGGANGGAYNQLVTEYDKPSEPSGSGAVGSWDGGGFSYSSAPSYTSKYQSQIDELTQQILGREAFTYDPEKDPTYQQYKDSYTRNGKRAMQDTMGQVAARTGGLASSYAGAAAQQTYDGYMSALADKVPELRQLAYQMYQDEGATQRANLEMLMALEQGDYAKYADLLAQYNTDRNFDYGTYRDQVGDSQWQQTFDRGVLENDRNFAYQQGQDLLANQRYEDETAYNREQDAWEKLNYTSEKEYQQALEKAQTLAAAGDFSGYKALGYTDEEIANLKGAYDKAQAAALLSQRSSSSGGGSGSSKGSGGNGGTGGADGGDGDIYSRMYDAGIRGEGDAYAWLLANGYNTTQAGKLAGYFVGWMEDQGGNGSSSVLSFNDYSVLSFNDYSEAMAYMQEYGVPDSNASNAMTKSEWTRRKASYQQYGQGSTEVTEYDSYADYLTAYVRYCIESYGGE